MTNKRRVMTSTILASLWFAGAATAQTAGDSNEIVVTGLRESLKKAIELKRNTDGISDAISAEDVGKYPDTNIAESLAHLPGISIDRQFGEGQQVSILGTDPALNRIFVDGHSIASSTWGGDPQDNSARNFNYTLLSPELIDSLQVFKSSEARLDEGSIGGTVLVKTRRPLDLEANTLRASLGGNYNDRSSVGNARGSALYSWKNERQTFGFLVGASYDRDDKVRSGIEYFGYSTGQDFASSPGVAITGGTAADLASARYPAGINFDYFEQKRQRVTLSSAFQLKPMDDLTLTLTTLNIRGIYDNYSQAEYIYPAASGSLLKSATVNNGVITSASLGSGAYSELDTNFRQSQINNQTYTLFGDWTPGNNWEISGNGGYTSATGGKRPEYLMSLYSKSAYDFSFDGTHTAVNYAVSPTNPSNFNDRNTTSQVGGISYQALDDFEGFSQLDFKRKVNLGPVNQVEFGGKTTDHTNSEYASGYASYPSSYMTIGDFGGVATPSGLFDGLNASGNATQYLTIPENTVESYILGSTNHNQGQDFGSSFKVRERINALYVQSDFAGDNYSGNVGVRWVSTNDQANYFTNDAVANTWTPTTVTHTYDKLLPSFSYVYHPEDDIDLRAAAGKVIARSRYTDLAGAFSRDDSHLTASGGNPDLKPYESINYDVSAEWYFAKGSYVSGELFYRDISNYAVTVTTVETLYDTARSAYMQYNVTSPINAQRASVKGFAPTFQYDFGDGFGLTTNYTYAIASVPGKAYNMPFLSRHTVSVIPYYEDGPWTTRVAYNFRTAYFTDIGRLGSVDMTDHYHELDWSGSYDVNSMFSVNASAENLLDETYFSYAGSKATPNAFYKNGRTFRFGLSFKM